jgi:hypothetical protein
MISKKQGQQLTASISQNRIRSLPEIETNNDE